MALPTKISEGTASRRLRLIRELADLNLQESDNPNQHIMYGFWSHSKDSAKQYVVRYTEYRGRTPTHYMVLSPALVLLWSE